MSFQRRRNSLTSISNRLRSFQQSNLIRPEQSARIQSQLDRRADRLSRVQSRVQRINQQAIDRAKQQELVRAHYQQTVSQPRAALQTGLSRARSQAQMFDSDVASSLLWRLRYNQQTLELDAWFNDGAIYRYFDVPFDVVLAVVRGEDRPTSRGGNDYGAWWETKNPSVGATFIKRIKKGGYRYQKLAQVAARPRVLRANVGGT